MKNITWKMSLEDSDLLMETLMKDAESNAFDTGLRKQIGAAIERLEVIRPSSRCAMTPEEFVAKHPKSERMVNCLEDIACPHCGNREQFKVEIKTVGELRDDGTDAEVGDHEYDDDSYIECCKCARHGAIAGFTIKGLDDLLTEKGRMVYDGTVGRMVREI